jgi:hypothetical protein
MFHDSTVLDSYKAKALVAGFVKEDFPIATAVKCYQGTKDGWDIDTFTKLVYGKGANIVLIKSDNMRTFGGFTSLSWERCETYSPQIDNSAFLFSVDENKKYKKFG